MLKGRRRVCAACSLPIEQPPVGRPRSYCSDACRQRAYAARSRRRAPRSEWWIPPEVRAHVQASWDFGLDAAACRRSALVPAYLGPDHEDASRRDALAVGDWSAFAPRGSWVWLNPPYTPSPLLNEFLLRAVATSRAGRGVIALLPASTGAAWWWEHVVDGGAEVEFLRGRLSFDGPHAGAGRGTTAPWASALVRWSPPRRSRVI